MGCLGILTWATAVFFLPFISGYAIRFPQEQQQHLRDANYLIDSSTSDKHTPPPLSQNGFYLQGKDSSSFHGDYPYTGIATFAHLDWRNCFTPVGDETFDVGIVGAPFDLGVTYRPGERFGPSGARMGSRRLSRGAGYSMEDRVNPFADWATVVDCGDISNSPFDKLEAIRELERGWRKIGSRKPRDVDKGEHVRLVSIGGDHTITLPALRALSSIWNKKVAILHFDSHLDTWDPKQLSRGTTKDSEFTHGSMLHLAHKEGIISNDSNVHVGSRSMLFNRDYDLENDARCGFSYILAREIDELGIDGIVKKIVERVGDKLVYLSVDIDVLDPAFAPATGTIEPGGWSTRELLQILHGLSKANITLVGADVVEFSPVYDNMAETTAITVSQAVYEIVQWMVHVPVQL